MSFIRTKRVWGNNILLHIIHGVSDWMRTVLFVHQICYSCTNLFWTSPDKIQHQQSPDNDKAGIGSLVGCVLPALAGAVFLHPDFGIDKQNKLYRKVHKYVSRALLMLAWCATLSGLKTLVGDDYKTLILFAAPMLIAAPFTLIWEVVRANKKHEWRRKWKCGVRNII